MTDEEIDRLHKAIIKTLALPLDNELSKVFAQAREANRLRAELKRTDDRKLVQLNNHGG